MFIGTGISAAFSDGPLEFKPVEAGAATSVWAATSPDLEGRGGLYLEDCQIGKPADEAGDASGYAPWALDPEGAARLWKISEDLIGEKFDFQNN